MPGSTHDNYEIRDGNSTLVAFRSLDISTALDGTKQRSLILSAPYPVDYGASVGGCYRINATSGSIAAGLAGGSPVYSMRNASTSLNVLLRRLRINGFTTSAGFSAGIITVQAYIARGFSVSDSGGGPVVLSSKNGAMRSALMIGSALSDLRIASTAALTVGTRTLDANPITRLDAQAPTAANTMFWPQPFDFIDHKDGEHPPVLGNNEGIIIAATVPATGVWGLSVSAAWDEVPLNNY